MELSAIFVDNITLRYPGGAWWNILICSSGDIRECKRMGLNFILFLKRRQNLHLQK